MSDFSQTFEVIWADMDPNRHMRHTAYNDYATQTRVSLFASFGLPIEEIADLGFGPVLFREETKFLKEIAMSENITVSCRLTAMRKDGSRWTFLHEIFKEDGSKAAEITVDGAWLNLRERKLEKPPDKLLEVVKRFPRSDNFKWLPDKE